MKKLINNFTGEEDYFLNWNEAAEHLCMSLGVLKFRHSNNCKLNDIFKPKLSVYNNKIGFWLKDMDHYKNKYSHLIPKKKPKVAEKTKSAEITKLFQS